MSEAGFTLKRKHEDYTTMSTSTDNWEHNPEQKPVPAPGSWHDKAPDEGFNSSAVVVWALAVLLIIIAVLCFLPFFIRF